MHNSNQTTVIYNWKSVWATNRNNIHNPVFKILLNQCCCKSEKHRYIEDSHTEKSQMQIYNKKVNKTNNTLQNLLACP